MPFFKTTYNIFVKPIEDELHNDNWFDTDFLNLPPSTRWDYKRDMQIEDVEIWEQIYFESGGVGLYVAWQPYAEFYMITKKIYYGDNNGVETFYGPMSSIHAYKRAVQLGMPINLNKIWVDNDDMWLHTNI